MGRPCRGGRLHGAGVGAAAAPGSGSAPASPRTPRLPVARAPRRDRDPRCDRPSQAAGRGGSGLVSVTRSGPNLTKASSPRPVDGVSTLWSVARRERPFVRWRQPRSTPDCPAQHAMETPLTRASDGHACSSCRRTTRRRTSPAARRSRCVRGCSRPGSRVFVVDDGSPTAPLDAGRAATTGPLPVQLVRMGMNRAPGQRSRAASTRRLRPAGEAFVVTLEADNTSDLDVLDPCSSARPDSAELVLASVHGGGQMLTSAAPAAALRGCRRRRCAARSARRAHGLVLLPRLPRLGAAARRSPATATRLIQERGFACKAELLVEADRARRAVEEVPVDLDAVAARWREQDAGAADMAGYGRLFVRERRSASPRRHEPADGRIVGGGILGSTAAHRLVDAGVRPVLFERAPELGGLAGAFDLDGHRVDRFYHVILPDGRSRPRPGRRVGLRDRMRFRPTKVGFYDDGRLFSMSSLREFLTFPLLAPHDRLRLAVFVARCQLLAARRARRDAARAVAAEPCGRRMVERLWLPLLDSKFDGRFDDLPATYIWARTRRMSGTRDAAGARRWAGSRAATSADRRPRGRDPRPRRRDPHRRGRRSHRRRGPGATGSSSTGASAPSTPSSARSRRRSGRRSSLRR